MIPDKLTPEEKQILLKLARRSLEEGVRGRPLPNIDPAVLTPALRAEGASFVTLTVHGDLRGCIGALEPYQPLAEDVREHAVAAALEDYRFPQVQENELAKIQIEVSRLTIPQAAGIQRSRGFTCQSPSRRGWSHSAGWYQAGDFSATGMGKNPRCSGFPGKFMLQNGGSARYLEKKAFGSADLPSGRISRIEKSLHP